MNDEQIIENFDKVTKDFKGLLPTLETAIGAYIVGRKVGWKVLYLVHDKRTIRKFEKILGIQFREELPDYGEWAHKSIAYNLAQKVSNFWKAVSGETKIIVNGKERPVRDPNVK